MHFKRILLVLIVMIFMTGTLSVAAATTASSVPPLEPWDSEVVDKLTGGYVGSHVSIAHYKENGRAYVSYYDATNHDLKLAYQVDPGTGNCPGTLDWKCSIVDGLHNPNYVGQFNSIDIFTETVYLTASPQGELNAQPPHYHYAKIGISYYDATAEALKFAIGSCNDATVCTWTITTVDDDNAMLFPDDIGQYSSFQFGTNATPVIYYHMSEIFPNTYGLVKHAYVNSDVSGECDAGWYCEVVAQSSNSVDFGTHISADGVRVVFYDAVGMELIMASPATGDFGSGCGLANHWICVQIDSIGDVGKFASLVNDGVNPMQVAYYDADNGKVKYAIETTAGTGDCTNNNFNCYAVDTIGVAIPSSHVGISLNLDAQGEPIIAYQDFRKVLLH